MHEGVGPKKPEQSRDVRVAICRMSQVMPLADRGGAIGSEVTADTKARKMGEADC